MRFIGKVSAFNTESGTGLIIQPDASQVYLHYANMVPGDANRLEEGVSVEYSLVHVQDLYPVAKFIKIIEKELTDEQLKN